MFKEVSEHYTTSSRKKKEFTFSEGKLKYTDKGDQSETCVIVRLSFLFNDLFQKGHGDFVS